jgi:thiol-disulfide isomerase/thioredoxin
MIKAITIIILSMTLIPSVTSLPITPQQKNNPTKKQIGKNNAPARIDANYGKYEFTFSSLEGRIYKLRQFGGKITLVNIWTPGCEPCKKETDGLVRLYMKYHPIGFEIIGIAIQTTPAEVHSFIRSHNVPWTVGIKDDIAKLYKSVGIPASYLFNPKGNLIKEFVGYADEKALDEILSEALTKPPAKKP